MNEPRSATAATQPAAKPLPESLRMLVFLELVQAQDEGLSVVRSRARVAAKHRLQPDQVRAIELEGVEKTWAPL